MLGGVVTTRRGMRNKLRTRFRRRENMDPIKVERTGLFFWAFFHSAIIYHLTTFPIESAAETQSTEEIYSTSQKAKQMIKTNKDIIQFPLIDFAITPRPPSPRRRTVPSRTRRYHPGTYGYPCCAPARTSESEKLRVTIRSNVYQKSTQPRCHFPQGWSHPSEPPTWSQSHQAAYGCGAHASHRGSYGSPLSCRPC